MCARTLSYTCRPGGWLSTWAKGGSLPVRTPHLTTTGPAPPLRRRHNRRRRDWMGKYEGRSARVALRPRSTEHAAALLRHCHERCLAVVPQVRQGLR